MAIRRIVKMTFDKAHCQDFEEYFVQIKERIKEQPGCHDVQLLKETSDKGIFFTCSIWEDQASLDAYRNTQLFGQVWPKVKKWFADKPEAWSTTLL